MTKTRKGVFCLEGEWDSDMRKRSSVEPLLQLIRSEQGHPYIFRDVGTLEELHFYLKRWLQYRSYRILYLAFHGKPEKICLGDKEVDLDSLEPELSGCCRDRVIVFASCSTLDLHGNRLNGFLKSHWSSGRVWVLQERVMDGIGCLSNSCYSQQCSP